MFTPLGIKTDYSLLKSLIKLEDLISRAKELGFTSLGTLDDNLSGSHIFYEMCQNNGIKPIIGLDIMADGYHLYLYPKNMDGLKNLFHLTKYQLDHVITIKDLKNYHENVIALVPIESRDIYENIRNIFENVFITFKDETERLNAQLISENIVYLNITCALSKENSKYLNYLYMIEKGLKLGDIELVNYEDKVLEPKEYDTNILTDLIDIQFVNDKKYIPHYREDIPDSKAYLESLAEKGLAKRLNNHIPDKYQIRLSYELKVIADMGYTDYFLIVLDYVRFAKKKGIFVGAGRGSAAGSLVAYSLGITWIDPLKYDLLFERFLNPERVTMPDIDIDFEDERRDEVVEYVKETYGINRVAKIMTYATLTAKDVLRVVAKINNAENESLNELLRNIDSSLTLKENRTNKVEAILKSNYLMKKVYEEASILEGLKKHIGTHAAGVVICSEDLDNLVPIIKSGNDYLTGYTMNELESLGLLKMDFLSIKNLTILSNTLKDIEQNSGEKIDIYNIPFDDPEVYKIFSLADTAGIFQFESHGLKSFLRKLKPHCFEDLVSALALYRPGPMQNIDLFLERRANPQKVQYIDDSLKPILESTYGIIIYQEQIMEILRLMANYSYAEADIVRRAMSKKKSSIIENEKSKFIANSLANGYSEKVANEVYELILRFADYGFNKSHTVAYAMIAYQMAYLKTHFREYYYINLLNTNIGGELKTREYINEAKAHGIVILKPDINRSKEKYSKERDGIRLPLRVIKGVGTSGSDTLIKRRGDRPFDDYFDFIVRGYGTNVNKKILEALILGGALDSFGYTRATLIKNIDAVIMYGDLIRNLDASLVNKPELDIVPEYSEISLM